ncbi:MAG: hypothetical protein HY304_02320, partial [candidate division Zixibacteria bacterium]|nr:hypothetical protein [candidate division Zixibacteria bacterium]
WATGAFLLAHSLIPNKQERFLLPILPLLIVMGTVGLELWGDEKDTVWRRWIHRGWIWFWVLNTPLLCLGLLDYANKPKIEPFLRLYEHGDATGVVMDFTERGRGTELPWFYLDGADPAHPLPAVYDVTHVEDLDTLRLRRDGLLLPKSAPLNYVVIFSEGLLPEHRAMIEQHLGKTEVLAHVGPSAAERLMMVFNPTRFPARDVWVCRLLPGG